MKKYMAPVTEIIDMEASAMICASNGGREGEISDNSGDNPYQNSDWYQDDPIDDDYGNLGSTAKSNSLWDDFED